MNHSKMKQAIESVDASTPLAGEFARRHIGPSPREVTEMLANADGPWLVPETTPETSRR